MKWIHIDIWFEKGNTWRKDKYLNNKEKKDFEVRIAGFLANCESLIKRKFYLYEDIPHCFIALELLDYKNKVKIEKWRKIMFDAPYIYKSYINEGAGDDKGNGEGFLDIINAFTDFYLFKKDNCITHIVHCCMEFMFQSRQVECNFYKNMAILYQVKKVNGKKVVYGHKKITPQLRKKVIKYMKKLDLRRWK